MKVINLVSWVLEAECIKYDYTFVNVMFLVYDMLTPFYERDVSLSLGEDENKYWHMFRFLQILELKQLF